MANTRQELQLIHTRKLATPGRKYYRDDGEIFVGTEDKRLKVLDKSTLTRFKPTETIQQTNVQSAIESIDSKLETKTKQVEIDFGNVEYKNYEVFLINDLDIKSGNIIIAQIAYEAPTNKSLDELDMDELICYAGSATEGSFKLIVKSLSGSVANKFKINYTVKWL